MSLGGAGQRWKGAALRALSTDLRMAAASAPPTLSTATPGTRIAGHLAHILYGVPHLMTSLSLEPLRPWKQEQLGARYRLSSWVERTAIEEAYAVIAVLSLRWLKMLYACTGGRPGQSERGAQRDRHRRVLP